MTFPAQAPFFVLAVAALLCAGAVAGMLRIEPEVDFVDAVPDHEGLPLYREMLERIDGIRFVAIHMAREEGAPSLRTPEGFDALVLEQQSLTGFLESRFPGAFGHQLSAFEAMKAGNYMAVQIATAGNAQESDYRLPDDATHGVVRDRTLANKSIDSVLAADGESALWLGFFATDDNLEARRLSGEVADALATWSSRTTEHPVTTDHQASGLLYSSQYTDDRNEQDLRQWGLIAAGAVAVALLWVLRRPTNILIALASVGVATLWTFGALGWLDVRISFLTLFLAPVVSGIGVDFAAHLLHRVEEESGQGRSGRDAVAQALRTTAGPIALAATTSAAGLAVLLLVPAPLFSEIGGVAALGILLGLLSALTLTASLRALVPGRSRRARRERFGPALARLARSVHTRPRGALAVVLLVSLGALAVAVTQTTIESGSAENEFPQDDPVIRLQHRIEDEYGAFQRAYLVVRGDMTDPSALAALHQAGSNAANLPSYRDATSITALLLADEATDQGAADVALQSILEPAGQAPTDQERLPQSATEAREALDRLFAHPLWRTIAPFTITREYDLAVVAVTVDPWGDQQQLVELRDALQLQANDLAATLGPDFDVAAAGSPVNRAAVIEQTPMDILLATAGSAGAVGLILVAFWARRGPEGIAMAGLGVGIVLVSALWLIAAVPTLDVAYALFGTANNAALTDMFLLAFAITVAVGVDDLVHLASRYWEARDHGKDPEGALQESFATAGRAITGTTLTTAVAFGVLGGVYFLQSKNLAILTAAGVLFAYLLTLLLVPAVLGRSWAATRRTTSNQTTPTPAD